MQQRWLAPAGVQRASVDVDLLVDPLDVDAAGKALAAAGYSREPEVTPGVEHHAHRWTAGSRVPIEVHWNLWGTDPTRVWQVLAGETEPTDVLGEMVEIPNEPARCLIVALHAAHHGAGEEAPLDDLESAISVAPRAAWKRAAALAAATGGGGRVRCGIGSRAALESGFAPTSVCMRHNSPSGSPSTSPSPSREQRGSTGSAGNTACGRKRNSWRGSSFRLQTSCASSIGSHATARAAWHWRTSTACSGLRAAHCRVSCPGVDPAGRHERAAARRSEHTGRGALAWLGVAADLHYLIHGLVLASPVELPLPSVAARPADVVYRLAPESEVPQAPSHSRADDPDDPWAIEHWIGDRLAVEFPGRATFELSRESVSLVAEETGDPDLVAHLLLDHVMPRVIALRGDLMLHAAGAIGPSGRAHLVLGKTGAGKSTTVAGLASAGWALLDDDGIRIVETDDGPVAMPGTGGIRLDPASANVLLPDAPQGHPMAKGHPKSRFPAEGGGFRMAQAPAHVAGVYLLQRTDVLEPRLESFGLADAVSTIVEHGFHMADEPAAIARQAFERATAIAAAAPVGRLLHSAGTRSSRRDARATRKTRRGARRVEPSPCPMSVPIACWYTFSRWPTARRSARTSALRVPDHVLSRRVGDETVLLSLADEHYYGLDGVGTRFWEIVAEGTTFEKAVDMLLVEYEVERDVLVRDLTAVVQDLRTNGLLLVDAT